MFIALPTSAVGEEMHVHMQNKEVNLDTILTPHTDIKLQWNKSNIVDC